MKVVPLRLQPGADLRQALEAWIGEQQEQAGCVISAVGSCRPMASTCTSRSPTAVAP
jgi:predicted DNA-binding protein with PD1-like motif